MAINIEVVADVSQVVGKTAAMADEYDRVSDTLKDMARTGDGAVSDLERSLRDGGQAADRLADNVGDAERAAADLGDAGRDAGRDLERGLDEGQDAVRALDRSVDTAFDSISDAARGAGRDVSREIRDGADGASEGVADLGDEAKMEAQSMAGSFDGSAESIADSFQALASVAFAGFGVAGMIAGAAAAAGIGMTLSKLQELAETNTEAKEKMAELGREIYEAGGALDAAGLAEKIKEISFSLAQEDVWYKWGDQAQTYIGLVKDTLGDLKTSDTQDVFKALAGDAEAAGRAQAFLAGETDKATGALEKHIIGYNELGPIYTAEGDALVKSNGKRDELIKKIEEQSGVSQDAAGDAAYFAEVMGEEAEQVQSATEALDEHASALAAAAGNAMSLTDAENEYVVTLAQMTEDIAHNGKSMDVNTESGRANRESLVDLAESANSVRDAQIAQGASTEDVTAKAQQARDAFIAQAQAAGLDADAAAALADSYGLIPGNVETLVAANGTEEAKAKIEGIAAPVDAPVNVTTGGTEAAAQAGVDSVQGTTAPVEVTTEGTDAAVQGRIDGIKGKEIKIDVDDEYTVKHVQDRIDGIRGKTIKVTAELDTVQFYRDLSAATAARTMTVTVNERKGTSVI